MELVAILRLLGDRRIVVALGVVVALAAGALAGRHAERRGAAGGGALGSLRMVLDTTDSQLVGAAPKAASSLPTRAALLADALATDDGSAIVARAAGVPGGQLAVVGPAARRIPVVDTPLVARVSAATSAADAPYVVDVIADEVTPLISIEAHAPERARAARLTEAAATSLRSLLAREDGSGSRGFVLDRVTPLVTRRVVTRAHPRLMMAGGALATFAGWCGCVVLGAAAAARMRRRAVPA